MGLGVLRFEETPNPNARKCVLDGLISDRPRSFRTAEEASGDGVASGLFGVAGVTNVLMNGGWVTVCKREDVGWAGVERGVRAVLSGVEPLGEGGR